MVLRDNINISDSEKIFGTAYKNSIMDIVILLTKKKKKTNRKVSCQISLKSNMNYHCSCNINSIMLNLRGNFQYLNKF